MRAKKKYVDANVVSSGRHTPSPSIADQSEPSNSSRDECKAIQRYYAAEARTAVFE